MDFKYHLETAWNTTLKHIAMLLIMTLIMLIVSGLTLGILTPVVFAGYIRAIIQMMRDGREPRIEDLFSQMKLFLPLLAFSIVTIIATLVGFSLFILPGLAIVVALTFGCLYMLPLMVDRRMDLINAIKTSWDMAFRESVADHFVVVILYIGLVSIGTSVFVGILFTLPFATVFLVSAYLEKTRGMQYGAGPVPSPPSEAGTQPPPAP